MFRKGRAFHRLGLFALVLWLVTALLCGRVFGCDVVVHVGVHLAGEEARMAVEELCTLLVKYQLAEPSGVHVITELGVDGAHVQLHILVVGASEATVVTLQA